MAARSGHDALYVVGAPYRVTLHVDGARREITVPEGMKTDLASVPRLARAVVGRVGPHLEAAIVHDCLFSAWKEIAGRGARRRDWEFANAVFDGLMRAG